MEPLDQLRSLRQSLPSSIRKNETLRQEMLGEARKLLLDLESDSDTLVRVCYQTLESAMILTAVRMGLFRVLNASPTVSSADAAKQCNADPILVARILRCLASYNAIDQHGSETYSPTQTSRIFAEKKNEAAIESSLECFAPGWLAMPTYLQERGWENATSHTDTALAKAFGHKNGATMWQVLLKLPTLDAFNTYMATFNEGHKSWTEFYPVRERLLDGADTGPDSVIMVDVGGGNGHQALSFSRNYPDVPGKFIVQDLAQGFPSDDRPAGIEYMEHDFTKEQPVKGARFYYMRYVPHDYPQRFNIELCSRIREAMKPGYSKLIVNEWIIPEDSPSRFMTTIDISLLTASGGMERTESLHREYLEKAGLKVTQIFKPDDTISESVIEAEVA